MGLGGKFSQVFAIDKVELGVVFFENNPLAFAWFDGKYVGIKEMVQVMAAFVGVQVFLEDLKRRYLRHSLCSFLFWIPVDRFCTANQI